MLTAAAAARTGTETFRVKGTVSYIMFPKLADTSESTSLMPGIPTRIPMGIPSAPIQRPSNSTEFCSCFRVAPTDSRIPNWRTRSFSEMVNEL